MGKQNILIEMAYNGDRLHREELELEVVPLFKWLGPTVSALIAGAGVLLGGLALFFDRLTNGLRNIYEIGKIARSTKRSTKKRTRK